MFILKICNHNDDFGIYDHPNVEVDDFGETGGGGGISSSILSVIFTDKFALSQSDARISVAYKISQ